MGRPEYNLIQRPDLIQRLQSFFGIRQAHVTPTLSPTVQPVVIVADLVDATKGTTLVPGMPTDAMRAGCIINSPLFAGEFSMAMVRNPVNSGRVISITMIENPNINDCRYGTLIKTADLTTIVATGPFSMDTRFKPPQGVGVLPPAAVCSFGHQAVDPFGTSAMVISFLGTNTENNLGPLPPGSFIIDEGDAFFAANQVVNQDLFLSIAWEEHFKVRA